MALPVALTKVLRMIPLHLTRRSALVAGLGLLAGPVVTTFGALTLRLTKVSDEMT